RYQGLRRLEDEACRPAQNFLHSLNFHEIDECVRNIERSLGGGGGEAEKEFGRRRSSREEEVDEGFGADEEAFKDSPNPSENGHSDGQRTSGIPEQRRLLPRRIPYANRGRGPAPPRSTSRCRQYPPTPPTAAPRPHRRLRRTRRTTTTRAPLRPSPLAATSGLLTTAAPSAPTPARGRIRFGSEGVQSSVGQRGTTMDRLDTDDELSYRRIRLQLRLAAVLPQLPPHQRLAPPTSTRR
ncbi:unnamed protein product, partial [Tetraodon nigroviridis]